MKQFQKYLIIFSISFGYAATYTLPYIKYVFYDQLLAGINCNNAQAGFLLTVYTIMNLILYVPGGWIADKFKPKTILVFSLGGTGVLNFIFAMSMNYTTALVVWVLLAFTTAFAFWPSVIKAIRLLGSKDEQGTLYGFFNGGVGVFSVVVSSLGLYAYGLFAANAIWGLKSVIVVQGISCCVSALAVFLFYRDGNATVEASDDDKFKSSDILTVLKDPMTWAISVIIFCCHGIYTSQSYFNPYMTQVVGVTATFSGILAIIRTHVLRMTCAPFGGFLADKMKSPAKIIGIAFVLMCMVFVVFVMLPKGTSATVAIALQLVLSAVTFSVYGVFFSCIEEVGIPRKFTGTTVAIASMIGYLPDMIYNPLFGHWLDSHKNQGYYYIFIFLAVSAVLGLFACILVARKGARVKQLG